MKKLESMKKKLVAALSVCVMSLGLVACGGKENKSEIEATTVAVTEATTEAATETEATPAATEAVTETENIEVTYPVTIIDSNGTEITFEEEPEKVVSVAPNLTEIIYGLGAEDKLVGRSDYCDYPAEVAEVSSVGSIMEPDVEAIISMEPDVVVVSTHFSEENSKKLEELNIKVVTLYDASDLDGVYDMIDTMGTVLNRKAEATDCIDNMKKTIAEVSDKVAGLEKPTVYYVVGYGEYGDFTATGDTFVAGMLEAAGGDNIAKDATNWSITLEEIVEADPSIIIISEFMKDDFMSQPTYCDLTAVKEGHVYTLDTNMLDRQGLRNADGIMALAKIFHPEAFE